MRRRALCFDSNCVAAVGSTSVILKVVIHKYVYVSLYVYFNDCIYFLMRAFRTFDMEG